MRLFSYIVSHDTGFAPNPFHGYCTLACCKPVIRRTAKKGDWVVGIGPKSLDNKLVYAMQITEEPITYHQYFGDPRFESRKPDWSKPEVENHRGDNIYQMTEVGVYRQLRSRHSLANGDEDPKKKAHDLSGRYVLISEHFYYFGSRAIILPPDLRLLIATRGHKCRFDEYLIRKFIEFVERYRPGRHAPPSDWPHSRTPGCI